jgi:Holliday junction resolvase RusA-like endonuclease
MTFRVYGTPIPQGSMRGFVSRGVGKARVILTSANTKTEPWRQDVAAQAIKAGIEPIPTGPVRLHVVFYLPRPKSRPKKCIHPDVRPDLDKLLRAVLDALTSIGFRDDAQVCELVAEKCYTGANIVGADITVTPL